MIYEGEKYTTSIDKLRETLETFGVAIIPNILDSKECDAMKNGMWDTLKTFSEKWDTPISSSKPESWGQLSNLFPIHSMLIQHHGIGHAQFIWDLRQNPKVVDIFAKLWNCKPEDLLVSFDGASFHMPPEVTQKGWFRKTWFHFDQSPARPEFECIQSWVTAFDVNEGDATLAVIEDSHKLHESYGKNFGKTVDDGDWCKFSTDEERQYFLDRGCVERCIKCPKGSMVFWDSRTAHCGVEASKGRKTKNFRCVAYLCYMPRRDATEKAIAKRIKAFEEKRMTTHWPVKVKLFPKKPRTYGAEEKPVGQLSAPVINQLGRKLVGYS